MSSYGDASKGECSSESTPKSRAEEGGPAIRHLKGARQISLPSQPLPLGLTSKLTPSIQTPDKPPNHQTLNNTNHRNRDSNPNYPHPAAIFIANNVDILQQILLYLPPKSLIRFQSVCKTWLSIISNPSFRRLHSRSYSTTAAATEALFLFEWDRSGTPSDLSFISLSEWYVNPMANIVSHLKNLLDNGEIVHFHSCNGLLSLVFKLNDYDGHLEFVVCNPTTREYMIIPRPVISPEIVRPRNFQALNIVFDPLKSDDYKLVYVWWEENLVEYRNGYTIGRYGFSVYASETGIWRDSVDTELIDPVPVPTYFGNGVLWNGDLHWVSDWKYTICFELDKNCLNPMMPCLPVEFGQWEFCYFGECNGCLYVIEVNDPYGVQFDVFEMAKDYSEWVLKYRIDLAPLTILYPSMVNDECFFAHDDRRNRLCMPYFLEDKNERKAGLLISLEDKVILYNINDAVVKELAEVRPSDFGYKWKSRFFHWKDTYRHIETLAYV